MKVVALLSGGKDSTFNMVKCVENGHEIIALANAHPPTTSNNDEMDSFLFQTVGFNGVDYIAESMELPLYKQAINGEALSQELVYSETANDETEDLYILLKRVKDAHPDVRGVSVGAIFSSYQGNRVKHVCKRLGLEVLAYLWERDQVELLQEMIDQGVEAVLIKTAAIGLGASDLGKTLSEMQPKLLDLHKKYQLHPCGEGGEFETFTLYCPLFKKRIFIDESEVITHSDDAFAPVNYLKLKKLHVE
ncbi:hypothetical protein H4219_000154 [Mycoemilia scoparia]|uniref:Diphthine--ammonia ligase n=1 Tax=Mycoemilia scoparia TaxID=417184 RepID=A0A9W8AA17_9FUNG|nr:hypothetical protein H4219_000154 [Mycoemilia scoparia]